jgi:hypothetical protein
MDFGSEDSLRNRLQLAASAIAITGVAMYGIGFLVLTIHHASFGIPLIGFLRPKIIAAGTLFSALAVIPVVVWLLSHRRNNLHSLATTRLKRFLANPSLGRRIPPYRSHTVKKKSTNREHEGHER